MTEITGEVVKVELDIDVPYATKSGTYSGSRLTFRAFGKVNEQCFTSKTLEFNPHLREVLEELEEGDKFLMVKEKKGKYNNVKEIIKNGQKSSIPQKKEYSVPMTDSRQESIVFQSSIKAAIDILSNDLEVEKVLSLAAKIAKEAISPDLNKNYESEEDDEDII